MHPAFAAPGGTPVPVWFVNTETWGAVRAQLGAAARRFAETAKFEPKAGQSLLLPGADGALTRRAVRHRAGRQAREGSASCPAACPACCRPAPIASPTRRMMRALPRSPSRSAPTSFTRYRKAEHKALRLELPEGVDGAELSRIAEGVTLARDLINTPANDMGPAELEAGRARRLRKHHGASDSRPSSATIC